MQKSRVPAIRAGLASILMQCACALAGETTSAPAAVSVIDDAGNRLTLPAPAKRIVSLAPHTTELIYAAGAGNLLVGVSQYSDYPAQARSLPLVGSSNAFDIEKIASLKPDLAVVWRSGNSAERIAKLRRLGIPIFESEPENFEMIASSMERLAQLSGTARTGKIAAAAFRDKLEELRKIYGGRPTVNVFYQIWPAPLMTLNDTHLVSQAIRLCGGKNVFGSLPQLAPAIGAEAVLTEDPEVIIAASGGVDSFQVWRRFPTLSAVRNKNLFTINADWMNRMGPRILQGAETICTKLEQARAKRQ